MVIKMAITILSFLMIRLLLYERLIAPFTDGMSKGGRDVFGNRLGEIACPDAHGQ